MLVSDFPVIMADVIVAKALHSSSYADRYAEQLIFTTRQ